MISGLYIIAGIHSTTNLKTYEETKKINQATIQSASKETLEEKGKKFIGMCSLFTWLIFKYLICVIDDIGVFKILSNI